MADVARRAGVSTATVSNALNGTGRVSKEASDRVRAAVGELGYLPSQTARNLKTGRSRTIGLVLPDITNPFFPKLAQDVERAASERGYAVLLADTGGSLARERQAVRNLISRGVEAILLVPAGADGPGLDSRTPVVLLDRTDGKSGLNSDHAAGGALVARHLLELGHREFVILAGPESLQSALARVEAMRETIQAAGITVPASRVLSSAFSVQAGLAAIKTLLAERSARFTAVLAANDALALGALSGLLQAGLRVPQEVSVTGFDDIPWAALAAPALTTVHQDTAALADAALRLALDGLKSSGPIPVQLIVRGSTARVDAKEYIGSGRRRA